MGGGKSSQTPAPAPIQDAPKPYQQEQEMSESAKDAAEALRKKQLAAMGQQGTIHTSPFGSQQQQSQQGKTLLGE